MRGWRPALLAGLSTMALACEGVRDGPSVPSASEFDLPFCAFPGYANYSIPAPTIQVRYGDAPWETVGLTGNVYRLRKAPKIVLDLHEFGAGDFIAATGDELAAVDCAVIPRWSHSLNGTVKNIEPALTWRVMPATNHGRNGDRSLTEFQIPFPDSGADLIMSTRDSNPGRVIVRRGVKGQQGETMPVFDMAGPEAQSLSSASVTLQSALLDSLFPLVCFRSGALRHRLYGGAGTYGGVRSSFDRLYSVPAGLRREGDIHEYLIFDRSTSMGGDCDVPTIKPLAYYYRDAIPTTLTFGPPLNVPTISVDLSKQCLPAHVELTSQAEYSSFVRFTISTHGASANVWITAGYLGGTPGTWSLDIPGPLVNDICPINWGPNTTFVVATAGGGRFSTVLGGTPMDGELTRAATGRSQPTNP